MKRLITLAAVLMFPGLTGAALAAQEDVVKHPSCKYCGMHREK
jgi:hypothetical protein